MMSDSHLCGLNWYESESVEIVTQGGQAQTALLHRDHFERRRGWLVEREQPDYLLRAGFAFALLLGVASAVEARMYSRSRPIKSG